jgi:hybrid cluster-associated redox disulfide protein
MTARVTKDMIISDILKLDRGTIPILLSIGMHCLGCPSSSGESLEDACAIHGIDVDQIVKELNDYLESKDAK